MTKAKAKVVMVPQSFLDFATRRCAPIIHAWAQGGFHSDLGLNQLCYSCYSQGLEDAMTFLLKPNAEPMDFQI